MSRPSKAFDISRFQYRAALLIFLWLFPLALFFSLAGEAPLSLAGQKTDPPSDNKKRAALEKIKALVGPQDAVLLADASGHILFAENEHTLLVPASILKLLTSLVAIDSLGENFRFKTEFFMDKQGNLKIKGYGDPLLISEVISDISKTLSQHLQAFNDLILDPLYFGEPLVIPGITSSLEPYDSPNGALCANFNTVYFKKEKGRFISAEPQTPLLPIILPGIRRSGLNEGRILLSSENDECLNYAGHLFLYYMNQNHISSTGSVRTGKVDPSVDRLILTHTSQYPLTFILQQLLEYSSNFIANQLLLATSAKALSEPANLDKGVSLLKTYALKELGEKNILLREGSGISRDNKISAAFMLKVLNRFYPYRGLMRREGNVYYKTGTLTGVRSRAGYIENEKGEFFRFVIILNTPGKSDKAVLNQLLETVQ
ncbi:MAG: D-alanyl-D-alanine carboxypeptidase [Proteobacteria bacterium]|nr:D-alanyl-D-alanine carboxypeptidase [Pseudomonadota bacterium]MBU4471431.1 D-alanyl-D-alanine carboxypeptidase [Pseudomonadota bacterium]MCG2752436.1 D-alanyl-D-alanine carboxypeptidase [Desulfobacteraceae bacterium]